MASRYHERKPGETVFDDTVRDRMFDGVDDDWLLGNFETELDEIIQ